MVPIKERRSHQREVILEELRGVTSHPRADDLYKWVRRRIPTVSPGTVYRNLRLLRDRGLIQELPAAEEEEASRWDGNPAPHYHFACRSCGAVLDLPLAHQEAWNRLAAAAGFRIEGHRATFYGLCPECTAKSEK